MGKLFNFAAVKTKLLNHGKKVFNSKNDLCYIGYFNCCCNAFNTTLA